MLSQCPLHTELGWADVLNSPSKFKNVKKYDQVYSSNLVADNQMNLGILVLSFYSNRLPYIIDVYGLWYIALKSIPNLYNMEKNLKTKSESPCLEYIDSP